MKDPRSEMVHGVGYEEKTAAAAVTGKI